MNVSRLLLKHPKNPVMFMESEKHSRQAFVETAVASTITKMLQLKFELAFNRGT